MDKNNSGTQGGCNISELVKSREKPPRFNFIICDEISEIFSSILVGHYWKSRDFHIHTPKRRLLDHWRARCAHQFLDHSECRWPIFVLDVAGQSHLWSLESASLRPSSRSIICRSMVFFSIFQFPTTNLHVETSSAGIRCPVRIFHLQDCFLVYWFKWEVNHRSNVVVSQSIRYTGDRNVRRLWCNNLMLLFG